MVRSVAIGIGCRRNTPASAIEGLARAALARLPRPPAEARLYSIARKADEPGMLDAARALGYDIVFLPNEDLVAAAPRLVTRSARVRAITGVNSVAEAAALAGAGPTARLIVPRLAANGATCAIAAETEDPTETT